MTFYYDFLLRFFTMTFYYDFLVADTQLYKRLCPSVGLSVGPSFRPSARVEKWENKRFRSFLCMCLCWKAGWVGRWVSMGVGCPCPPLRNDIVTPRHLFSSRSHDNRLASTHCCMEMIAVTIKTILAMDFVKTAVNKYFYTESGCTGKVQVSLYRCRLNGSHSRLGL